MGPAAAARTFYKMTGSGNDFVFFDARGDPLASLREPAWIRAICARGTGVGADGVVLLGGPEPGADFRMTYWNADGSRAAMCGNAALCATALAARLKMASPIGMHFQTDSGIVSARVREVNPEIDLAPVHDVVPDTPIEREAGERRIGFAIVGVPHLVILCDDVQQVDVAGRGRLLRWHPWHRAGMNANFVSRHDDAWLIRTFERGVEGETLACGTGTVASAILLEQWGCANSPTAFRSRSGAVLRARLQRDAERWLPSLEGEGRLVFTGELPSSE